MSKNKNRYEPQSGVHQPVMEGEQTPPPTDTSVSIDAAAAIELHRRISDAMIEHGTPRLTIEFDASGFLKSIEPAIAASNPQPNDIIVHCPRTGKKCVATWEVKRADTGQTELCCVECVGPSHANEYQKML